MYAVGSGGASTIVGLNNDASKVMLYTGVPGVWTAISTNGASSVAAGGRLLATDFGGNAYLYSGIPNNWSVVSGPADQFLVNGVGMAALTLDHQGVYANISGTSSGWAQIGFAASEMFIGSGSSLAATALTSTKDIYYYQGSSTSWVDNGGAGNGFAVTTNGTLYGLTPNQAAVFQPPNTSSTKPTWIPIGGSATRLIGHGNTLYATQGITY
jgi:alpha-tubulin suppressor-like RCC1 family protein